MVRILLITSVLLSHLGRAPGEPLSVQDGKCGSLRCDHDPSPAPAIANRITDLRVAPLSQAPTVLTFGDGQFYLFDWKARPAAVTSRGRQVDRGARSLNAQHVLLQI